MWIILTIRLKNWYRFFRYPIYMKGFEERLRNNCSCAAKVKFWVGFRDMRLTDIFNCASCDLMRTMVLRIRGRLTGTLQTRRKYVRIFFNNWLESGRVKNCTASSLSLIFLSSLNGVLIQVSRVNWPHRLRQLLKISERVNSLEWTCYIVSKICLAPWNNTKILIVFAHLHPYWIYWGFSSRWNQHRQTTR